MLRRLATVLSTVLLAMGLVAVPASANGNEQPRYYLALGDSLAYGYQPTHVTGQGYVDQLYARLTAGHRRLGLVNLGCPGETTGTMINGGVCPFAGFDSQLAAAEAFLAGHRGRVALVTLDIGGNDLDRCASGGTLNQTCVAQGLAAVASNGARIVAGLRAAAGPEVTFAAMTYYNPFLAAWLAGPAGQQLAVQSAALTVTFNGLLTGLYTGAGFRVAPVAEAFSSTDLTTQVPLPGFGTVPLAVARICQWTWMCAPAPLGPDIHANQAGYAVLADAFATVLVHDDDE